MPLHDSHDIALQRWKATRKKATQTKTFKQVADEYLRIRRSERHLSPVTQRTVEEFVNYWGAWSIQGIAREDVEHYIATTMHDLSPATVHRKMAIFKAVLAVAVDHGWLFQRPRWRMPRYADARTEYLYPEQVTAMLEWVKKHHGLKFYEPLLLLVDTGARLNEVHALTFGDITKAGVRYKYNTPYGKTHERVVPLTPSVEAAFLGTKEGTQPAGKKVIDKWENKWGRTNSMTKALGLVLKEALAAIGHPNAEGFRVHDLRHTFAYMAAQAGADLGDLQMLMGHSNLRMTLRYRGYVKSRAESSIRNMR